MYSQAEISSARIEMLMAKLAYLRAERKLQAMIQPDIKVRHEIMADIDVTFASCARELAGVGLHANAHVERRYKRVDATHVTYPYTRGQHDVCGETGIDSGSGGC